MLSTDKIVAVEGKAPAGSVRNCPTLNLDVPVDMLVIVLAPEETSPWNITKLVFTWDALLTIFPRKSWFAIYTSIF